MIRWQTKLFILAIFALIFAATLQNGSFLFAFGIKPNLVLVLLAIFVFFVQQLFPYAILVLIGATFLRFAPGFGWEVAVLTLVGLLFYYVRDRFLSSGLIGSLVFTLFGTLLFYLLLEPAFLYHEGVVVAKELLYNGLLGAILFVITRSLYEKKGGSPIR